jgi:hypothetical protein
MASFDPKRTFKKLKYFDEIVKDVSNSAQHITSTDVDVDVDEMMGRQ